jgi:hypothetical protein
MVAGQLEIQMIANMARLHSDMKKADSTVTGAMTKISSAVSGAMKLLGALGLGLSVNLFGRFIKGSIDAQDNLAKMSQQINVSVESLAGLGHAAGLGGSSLEAIQKALKTVSTQLFDADKGLAESIRNFSSLGIEVHTTTGALKSADSVMIEVADQFAQMENGTMKTALAVKLFGRSGLELIPMLNAGSAGLAEMIAEGQKLNPVTAESAAQAEIFNDNLLRLTGSVSSVGVAFVNTLLPGLTSFSEKAVEFSTSGDLDSAINTIRLSAEALAIVLVTRLAAAIALTGVASVKSTIELLRYQTALAGMAGVSTTAAIAQTALATSMGTLRGAMALLGGPITIITGLVVALYVAYNKVTDAQDRARKGAIEYMSGTGGLESIDLAIAGEIKKLNELNVTLEKVGKNRANPHAAGDYIALQKEQANIVEYINELSVERVALQAAEALATTEGSAAVEVAADAYGELSEESFAALNQITATGIVFRGGADDAYVLADSVVAVEKELSKLPATSSRVNRQMQFDISRTRDEFGNNFADMLDDGEGYFNSLRNAWRRMLKEMAGEKVFTTLFGDSPTFNLPGGSAASSAASGATNSFISSAGGGVVSAAMAGLAFEAAQAGSLLSSAVSGLTGVNTMVAPGTAVGGLGSTITTAIAAIPGWGWALLAAGAAAAILNNDDGKTRENAGFFVAPTPGAVGDPRAFDVDPFASGLNVKGFARRADQAQAVEVINVFRDIDFAFVEMISSLNGTLDLTNAALNGLDEEATAGSQGTFLGLGGNGGLGGDIPAQINSYIEQLVNHVGGLDESLISAIQAAADGDEVFAILAAELEKRNEIDAIAIPIAAERNSLQQELDDLTLTRIELLDREREALDETNQAIFDSIRQIENLALALGAEATLKGALADARSALRAVGNEVQYLLDNSINAGNDVERAQQRINDLNRESADAMRDFAQTIDQFLVTLSPASYGQNLAELKAQLLQTAGLASGGDLDAQSQLISQAQMVIKSAEASSSTRADFFRQEAFVRTTLLGVRDTLLPQGGQDSGPSPRTQIELAEDDLAAALAIQVLADSALEAGRNLTGGLTLLTDGPVDNLIVALGELEKANNDVISATALLDAANIEAGIELTDLARTLGLTNAETIVFMDALELAGVAAEDFMLMLEDDLFISSNATLLANISLMFDGSSGLIGQSIASMIASIQAGAAAAAAAAAAPVVTAGNVGGVISSPAGPVYGPTQAATDAGSILLGGIAADDDYSQAEIFSVVDAINAAQLSISDVSKHFNLTDDVVRGLVASAANLPRFATGGNHYGGLRIVGENGPEIEATGASRIYSNSQTRQMMQNDNPALLAEIRAMRVEISGLRSSSEAATTASEKTSDILEQLTYGEESIRTKAVS